VTRWAQAKRLRTVKGRVPIEEADRMEQELHAYEAEHANLLAGLDAFASRVGTLSGTLTRHAVALCGEAVELGKAWTARGAAPTAATQELSADLRSRIADIAAIHDQLQLLEGMQGILPSLLPQSPRQALYRLAVTVGGMAPERAREIIGEMDDDTVASKLAEFPQITTKAPEGAEA
jgi:hypothetical protein